MTPDEKRAIELAAIEECKTLAQMMRMPAPCHDHCTEAGDGFDDCPFVVQQKIMRGILT